MERELERILETDESSDEEMCREMFEQKEINRKGMVS